MITGLQIRMARSALRWSVDTLANQSNVSVRTIKRMESSDGIPGSNAPNLKAIQSSFEQAGIEFIGTPGDRPGIRIGKPRT